MYTLRANTTTDGAHANHASVLYKIAKYSNRRQDKQDTTGSQFTDWACQSLQ